MICPSVYLLVFIRNLLVHLAEKILPMQPLTSKGGLPSGLLGTLGQAFFDALPWLASLEGAF